MANSRQITAIQVDMPARTVTETAHTITLQVFGFRSIEVPRYTVTNRPPASCASGRSSEYEFFPVEREAVSPAGTR